MIGTVLDLLLGPLGGVLAGIVAIAAAWAKGRRDGRQEAARKADAAYRKTRERIDEAERSGGPVSDAEWLRNRGQR